MSDSKDPKNNPKKKVEIAFIEDPFAIKTLEIVDAQNSQDAIDENLPEEIDGDSSLEQNLGQLQRLTAAIAEESERAEKDGDFLLTEATAEDVAEKLAAQIAEDKELARQLAEEAEADENGQDVLDALPKEPVTDESGAMDLSEMESCIEALLFMSDKPLSMNKLRDLLGPEFSLAIFQEAMTSLRDRYKETRFGTEIAEVAGGFQLRTKPGRAPLAKKLAKVQTQRLSTGAMESLAIIAYRQPVMKDDIDKIRGVDSSYFIRGLLDRKLIKISARSELPGRPMLYATTDAFLELFALKDLAALPSLRELEQMIPASETETADEDPRIKELRKMVGQINHDHSQATALNYNPEEDEQILKEMKERISAISTTTPYIEEQKALAKLQAEGGIPPENLPEGEKQADLGLNPA